VRFAARFGFEIEAETFRAIRRHVAEIHQVSRERLREEITKMLTEGAVRRAFELLDETWLLQQVLPEIGAMKGVEQPAQYHPEGDVWIHTLLMLEGLPAGASPTLAWGVLLHDVGKPPTFQSAEQTGDRIRFNDHVEVGVRMAEAICKRLRFSNEDTEQILALVDNHMRFGAVEEMRASTLKKFVRLPHFGEHLALHRLDCLSSRPERLLTGDDLQSMGFRPGPLFAQILRSLEDAQLDGQIRTREEAEEHVRRRFATKEQGTASD
jgi:poly(A) polymerase